MFKDRVFRESMSETAKQAASIVDRIRLEEQHTLWTNDYEQSLAKNNGHLYPGMMFSLAKERMESSQLFKIIKQMPKGALLHCHLEAMVEFKYILADAFEFGNVYFRSSESLTTPEALENATVSFVVPNEPQPTISTSVWTKEYKPETIVSLNQCAETFPGGNRSGFVSWMTSRCSITPSESIRHHDGPNEIWRKFLSTFLIIQTIIYHPPIFRRYIRRLCQQLHNDGIKWADVRAVFYDPALGLDEQRSIELIGLFGEEVESFKNSEGKGFWGMRIIWTWPRFFEKQSILYCEF
jgi:adenosine deaminase CECR1